MKKYSKRDFPVSKARELLEPGPIVLVSSAYKGEHNIMTMGWHTMMEFSPSLIGCIIAGGNHSFELIRKSKQCVINLPTVDMAKAVVGIGNSDGDTIDKFDTFGLTPAKAAKISAPLIKDCYANFECRLYDGSMIDKYNFFIFEIVKIHKAISPKIPKTIHHQGKGRFMVAGKEMNMSRQFRPENL